MKFVLVKLSALALVATHTTFAKGEAAIQLRGAIPLENEFFQKSDVSETNEESGDKKKSAHKRQEQRDARRSKTNSNRSQEEGDNERRRKDKQARNRGNRCTDPSEPGCGNDDFPRNREAKRKYRCETRGESCEHGRTDSDNEPNRRRANEDMDCVDWCHENNYDDSDADQCVNKNCASNGSWIFNGVATYGEYLDLLLEEANVKP